MSYNKNTELCAILSIQERLNKLKYNAGPEDNDEGPQTREAMSRFKAQHGFDPRPYTGPLTLSTLFSDDAKQYVPPETVPPVTMDPNSDAPWAEYALLFLGLKEIPGTRHAEEIVLWGKQSGITWWNNDEDAWCAVFVNGCLVNTGYRSTVSAMARSFAGEMGEFAPHGYGKRLNPMGPLPRGTIIVLPRGKPPSGHVAIVLEDRGPTVKCINGNVSNMVKESVYDKRDIVPNGARWPDESTKVTS